MLLLRYNPPIIVVRSSTIWVANGPIFWATHPQAKCSRPIGHNIGISWNVSFSIFIFGILLEECVVFEFCMLFRKFCRCRNFPCPFPSGIDGKRSMALYLQAHFLDGSLKTIQDGSHIIKSKDWFQKIVWDTFGIDLTNTRMSKAVATGSNGRSAHT